jgi:hypothetical protein
MFVLLPQQREKSRVLSKLSDVKNTYNQGLKYLDKQVQERFHSEMESLRSSLGEFVFDYDTSGTLSLIISRIAEDGDIISPVIKGGAVSEAAKEKKHIYKSNLFVDFSSDFNRFVLFLNALERNRPVVFVDDFKISGSSDNKSSPQVNMKLTVFVQKPVEL